MLITHNGPAFVGATMQEYKQQTITRPHEMRCYKAGLGFCSDQTCVSGCTAACPKSFQSKFAD
jgi:hypothetical protein